MKTAKARSFIKYPGSKLLMMDRLLKHVPAKGSLLVEAFCGGCSLSLNTDYQHYCLNDANADLVSLYRMVQRDHVSVIREASRLFTQSTNTHDFYYQIRNHFNASSDREERAILLLYLSKHCFNGLLRFNAKGEFNTPMGRYKNPYFPIAEITYFAEKFASAEFYSLDFVDFIQQVTMKLPQYSGVKSCYLDPPYLPLDGQGQTFTQYTAEGFKTERHMEIDRLSSSIRPHFSHVLVSNHYCKTLKATYKSAKRVIRFKVSGTISSKARRPASEVLLYY